MKKWKNLLALLLCVAMVCASLAGCKKPNNDEAQSTNTPKVEETFQNEQDVVSDVEISTTRYPEVHVAMKQTPPDLTPWSYTSGGKMDFLPLVYEALFHWNNEGFVPWLAKSYTEVDELHYDVTLYEGIKDSDGNTITADDVVFSYNKLQESGYAVKYHAYAGIEKIDDLTVRFTWAKPIESADDLEHVLCKTFVYSEKAHNDHNFAAEACGTGPYEISDYVGGSSITFEAKDEYWQVDEAIEWPTQYRNVQTMVYEVIAEASQNLVSLQTGNLSISTHIPPENVAEFEDGGKYADQYDVQKVAANSLYYILCNNAKGFTADKNFRLAVYYAINKEAVAKAAGNAQAVEKFGSHAHPDVVDSWATADNYMNSYSLETSKEYLAKTDYKGETLVFMGANDEVTKNAMVMIQSLLAQAGINVEIKSLEQNLFNANLVDEDAFDILISYAGGTPLIGGLNRLINDEEFGTGKALGFIDDAKYQELFDYAKSDAGHNDEGMNALYEHIVDNAYFMTIFNTVNVTIYSSDIESLYVDLGKTPFLNASNFKAD